MNFHRRLWLLFLAAGLSCSVLNALEEGAEIGHHIDELNDRDLVALKDFLRERREALAKEQQSPLKITGDARMEWRHRQEKLLGRTIFGPHRFGCDGIPISRNDFDIEANVRFNYVCKQTWAELHFQYDNAAGVSDNLCCCDAELVKELKKNCKHCPKCQKQGEICTDCLNAFEAAASCTNDRFHGSGRGNELSLKRAYMGYTICESEDASLDIEIGRRKLYDVFESDIQFLSRMDGLTLRYSAIQGDLFEWYVKGAAWVIDETVNHFGFGAEAAIQNIYDTGFDIKYSIVDWVKHGRNRCGGRDPIGFRYLNSQLLLDYHLDESYFCMPVEIYGAIVVNHLANELNRRRQNAFRRFFNDRSNIEELEQALVETAEENDINDVPIILVEAVKNKKCRKHHSHHGWDGLAGYIGVWIGKVRKQYDWSLEVQYQYVERNAIAYDDQSGITLNNELEGCCDGFVPDRGYQGVQAEFLYALTDHFSLDMVVQFARQVEERRHHFSEYKLEAVYAF